MSSKLTNLLCDNAQALLFEVRADLSQLLERYQVTKDLTINIPSYSCGLEDFPITCEFINGFLVCVPNTESAQSPLDDVSETALSLVAEETQQLSKEVASRLEALVPQLNQAVGQEADISEVQLEISSDSKRSGYPTPCRLIDGIIICKIDGPS